MSMKKSSDTIGNRNSDLPVRSAVPQPLRHRVPHIYTIAFINPRLVKMIERYNACYNNITIHTEYKIKLNILRLNLK
jgi:hypothetical protein